LTLSSANLQAKSKFTGLDVLRGIAAISVVLFHASEALKLPWLMPNGGLAVDVFFVMSGFVIAHAYESRIPELGFSGFLRLRAIRFYPLYMLGLSVGILRQLLVSTSGSHELSCTEVILSTLAALVFLPAPPSAVSDSIAPLNGPAWSLVFEIWINSVYALLFKFMTTPILFVAVVLAGASIVVAVMHGVGLGWPHWHDLRLGGSHWHDLPAGASRVIYSFALGVLIYRNRDFLKVKQPYGIIGILAAALCFMLPYSSTYVCIFVIIISPMIVIWSFNCNINRVISDYCGIMSYFMYAVHWPVLLISIGIARKLGIPVYVIVVGTILAMLLAVQAIDKYYDRPIRKRLLGFHLSEVSMANALRRWFVRQSKSSRKSTR
jgi:peptidoglycan/LPS O-acetylase OafA/YrhL